MPELNEVFKGVLGKALNLPETEVSSLFTEDGQLKDDAETVILGHHAKIVQAQRDKEKSARDEQYKRGLREKGTEFEKLLKEAGVDIGDAIGADAVQRLKDHIAAAAKPSDLDDDKVKNSKLFRQREKELLDQLGAKELEHKQYITDRDAKEQRERALSVVRGKVDDQIKVLKPVNLSEDPEKAKRQLLPIRAMVEAHTYQTEGDVTYVIAEDGKRVETANGHPVTVEQFIEGAIKATYDMPVSTDKGSAGDPTKGTEKGKRFALKKPANREELGRMRYEIQQSGLPYEERKKLREELDKLAEGMS